MQFHSSRLAVRFLFPSRVLLACLLASALGPGLARAERAQPDTTFIEAERASVLKGLEDIVPTIQTAPQALEAISLLLIDRRGEMAELDGRLSPTSLDGIETQDRVDRFYLIALHAMAHAGVAADTADSPVELAMRFRDQMGPLPDMGPSPLPFMVLRLAELAVSTADTLRRLPDFREQDAAKLAVRLIHTTTHDLVEAQEDVLLRANTEKFRHKAVLVRLRCPKDGGTYRTVDMKTKLHGNGDISTIYILNCNVCGEAIAVDYPSEIASKLNRIADRQQIRKKPRPTPPPSRLDP